MKVLLIGAGASDDAEQVLDPGQWPLNLGSERDWGFVAKPNPHLNDRALAMSMGKALGGGSSVNVMVWARGHRNDWDFFAEEAGDGRDAMSVVDGSLRAYGNDQLRIADGSIMPRVTIGNSQAPCSIIGERAAEAIIATQ